MIYWNNTGLPLPSQNYRLRNESSTLRTKMDSGRYRQRQRFTNDLTLGILSFVFDEGEFARFQIFWESEIKNGSDWFKIPLALGRLKSPLIPDQESLRETDVRPTAGYQVRYLPHLNYEISFPIELLTDKVIDKDVLDVIEDDPQEFLDAIPFLQDEVNHMETLHPFKPRPTLYPL